MSGKQLLAMVFRLQSVQWQVTHLDPIALSIKGDMKHYTHDKANLIWALLSETDMYVTLSLKLNFRNKF